MDDLNDAVDNVLWATIINICSNILDKKDQRTSTNQCKSLWNVYKVEFVKECVDWINRRRLVQDFSLRWFEFILYINEFRIFV